MRSFHTVGKIRRASELKEPLEPYRKHARCTEVNVDTDQKYLSMPGGSKQR